MRSVWYLLNDHVKDNEQIQRCGSINLMYMKGEFPKNMNYDLMQRGTNVFNYTPLKFVGVYALMDGERNPWSNVLDLIVFAFARVLRLRTRALYGAFPCALLYFCWQEHCLSAGDCGRVPPRVQSFCYQFASYCPCADILTLRGAYFLRHLMFFRISPGMSVLPHVFRFYNQKCSRRITRRLGEEKETF